MLGIFGFFRFFFARCGNNSRGIPSNRVIIRKYLAHMRPKYPTTTPDNPLSNSSNLLLACVVSDRKRYTVCEVSCCRVVAYLRSISPNGRKIPYVVSHPQCYRAMSYDAIDAVSILIDFREYIGRFDCQLVAHRRCVIIRAHFIAMGGHMYVRNGNDLFSANNGRGILKAPLR